MVKEEDKKRYRILIEDRQNNQKHSFEFDTALMELEQSMNEYFRNGNAVQEFNGIERMSIKVWSGIKEFHDFQPVIKKKD